MNSDAAPAIASPKRQGETKRAVDIRQKRTGWLRAAAIADAVGIDMSTHLYPEISSHLMRITPTAHWLEWQDWAHPILAEPFKVVEGHIRIRDVPGNGLEWNEDAVSRYRFDV